MLVFLGNPGLGKTYLCAAIYNYLYDQNPFKPRYWNERQLLTRVREGMDMQGDYLGRMKFLIDDHFLILDDLGSSGINEWRNNTLFEVLDQRYSSGLPTLITSNLGKDEIYSQIGPRFHSRLFAKENTILEMNGVDLRSIDIN